MDFLLSILVGMLFLACISVVIAYCKICVLHRAYLDTIDAIYYYKLALLYQSVAEDDGPNYATRCRVDYSDMRDYNEVLGNIFAWGRKSVLSKDKYKIIKPYFDTDLRKALDAGIYTAKEE